jgi:hypothetical protein
MMMMNILYVLLFLFPLHSKKIICIKIIPYTFIFGSILVVRKLTVIMVGYLVMKYAWLVLQGKQ